MGRPVECRNAEDAMDGKFGRQNLRDSRRVYSDLGFRSNLMELMGMSMSGVEGECGSDLVGIGTKSGSSKRYGEDKNGGFGLRRNRSAGETSQGDVFARLL